MMNFDLCLSRVLAKKSKMKNKMKQSFGENDTVPRSEYHRGMCSSPSLQLEQRINNLLSFDEKNSYSRQTKPEFIANFGIHKCITSVLVSCTKAAMLYA